NRDKAIISVHTHNDRGAAVAAAELSQMAGAERVEGTLFGYGERTGNVDIVTLALNLYSQGVDPGLDLSNLNEVSRIVTKCTDNPIHQRHPYSGELVFTAFSGSHQDAISKGMKEWNDDPSKAWDVPYIPIDPKDIGRDYSTIIRVNSQSGKGGVAYLLREQAGFELPRQMQPEFSQVVQKLAEQTGKEVGSEQIAEAFKAEYIDLDEPFELVTHEVQQIGDALACHAVIRFEGRERPVAGKGNGPIDAFVAGLSQLADIEMVGFHEHSLGTGSDSRAAAYVLGQSNGRTLWGVGVDESATAASLKAVVSALNRLERSSRSC
ncbi:MAG TPA: alpha-isopropylmalate synthase regulatory domain-containing protein, partial [Fimbriimonas sp.]|nr:alpha-isopropylmalate synthase regulatory domain-containing protein [Fimbriimonas sp.]